MDIAAVRKVLDEDHYGLEKVKKRILEYLAVRKLKQDKKGPILCLIGPPGVGKTSLGRSIARALGRKFVRISLGGVHDEAAIRGHRRTYVGALPGQIIQGMKKAGTINPVFMLDEVDKIGHDFRGDPAAALLEVLDPEQNNTFADHYLEIPYDLSNVMFIATANVADPIPPPLRDRMEILEIPGYTRREKLAIAKQHLLPKQLEEHGLTTAQIDIQDTAIDEIIDSYTREAGVRNLERQIASVIRGVAVKVAEGEMGPFARSTTTDDLREFLGAPKFTSEVAERTDEPGVATGLAWTPVGGEILFIEATRMYGTGKLQLTGPARRRHEGVGAGGALLRAHARRAVRHREGLPREERPPHPHPGRRHAQGRAERRRDDVHRARVAAHRHSRAPRRRDDRRDHAARQACCRSAASKRRCSRPTARASSASSCPSATRRTSTRCRRKCETSSSSCRSPRWTKSCSSRARRRRTRSQIRFRDRLARPWPTSPYWARAWGTAPAARH